MTVVALMGAACGRPPAPVQAPAFDVEVLIPDREAHWYIPLGAKNSDFVCVETLPKYPNYCVSIGELRKLLVVQKVDP